MEKNEMLDSYIDYISIENDLPDSQIELLNERYNCWNTWWNGTNQIAKENIKEN